MSETGEGFQPAPKEVLTTDNNKWKNLLGEDVCKDYQPQPHRLVDQDGYSTVNPNIFNRDAILEPIRDPNSTEMVVSLNKIIAMDTGLNLDGHNNDPIRLRWEVKDHISVNKVRELIRNGQFDFNNTDGLYGLELPGGYIIATGDTHRLTGTSLENVSEVKMKIQKMIPNQFSILNNNEDQIRQAVENGTISGIFGKDKWGDSTITINDPKIDNPIKLFGSYVPTELIDVLAPTL